MLVLGRKVDGAVEIIDTETGQCVCRVVVTSIDRGKVKLGFDADRRYKISRSELISRREGNNE